jgi:hypothetical protein
MTPPLTPTVAAILGTVNRNANLRAGPGTNYAVVGGAKAGQTVQILDTNAEQTWYQLVDQSWIAAFLVTLPPPLPLTLNQPIRGTSPQIFFFTVTPTTTLRVGDKLALAWAASGEQAEICPILGPGPGLCQEVPLAGNMTIVTDEQSMAYSALALRVTAGQAVVVSGVTVHLQCQNLRAWFFAKPPLACPTGPPSVSKAAFQRFEHGMMIWLEGPQEAPDDDTYYLFFQNDPAQTSFLRTYTRLEGALRLKPGASPDHRTGEMPPPGRFEPVSGFGLLWRGEVELPPQVQVPDDQKSLRQRLGWALAPEVGYDFAEQCEVVPVAHYWKCYIGLPDGKVLSTHPDSTAQVRWLWAEWQGPDSTRE